MPGAGLRVLAALLALTAEAGELWLAWKDLNQWIGPDKRIQVETREKVVLVGVLEEVRSQSMKVDVRYSSDQRHYAKGETVIPYSAISRVAVRKETNKGRRRGVLIMLPPAALGAPLAAQAASSNAGAVAAGIMAAAQLVGLGYLPGLGADNRWTYVTLEPPPAAASPEQAPAEDVPADIPDDSLIEIDVVAFI